ncbi:hypothetical protein GCM10020255_017720 [Rhodococcus baikonurensis]
MRSAFAMTEPAPGAGSDPSALNTRAEKVPGGWKINGKKWFITGADGAGFFIIMARTSGEPGQRGGATMFLAPTNTAGLVVGRHIDTLDKAMIGGQRSRSRISSFPTRLFSVRSIKVSPTPRFASVPPA